MPANQPFTIKRQITPPGLDHAERGFELESGEKMAVRIVQHESQDEGFITMMVEGRLIDDAGATALEEGVPVVCPPKVRTIHKAALSEGQVTIEGEMAEATTDMLRQVKNNLAAIRAWQKIPAGRAPVTPTLAEFATPVPPAPRPAPGANPAPLPEGVKPLKEEMRP
ncbi:MAG TPA: hypothetical protein VHG28_12970 [Longimicrobiaceae bacterium]|nr:hypothetical protein [Longimicrobiaceae bacterium]